jgi:hypothetical protein
MSGMAMQSSRRFITIPKGYSHSMEVSIECEAEDRTLISDTSKSDGMNILKFAELASIPGLKLTG